MSAEFVDALKGYEYYLKERGDATIDDVNNYLGTHGRKTIKARTYNHYRKLLAHGFRSYIPINQFDVFQALGKLQMAADRRRYQRDKIQAPAKVSLDRKNWRDAVVTDKSLVGIGLNTLEKFSVSKGTKIWIRLDDYDDIPVILVWRNHDQKENGTKLGVRAFEFIARYRLEEEVLDISRLIGVLEISREQEGILVWEDIYRVFEKTNQLLDAVNALIHSIDDVLDSKVHIARPVLMSVNFGSPGELQTKVDFGFAEILKVLIEMFKYWSLDRNRYKEENIKRQLENANLSIEVARNVINFHKEAEEIGMADDAIAALLEPVKRVFGLKRLPKNLFNVGTPERGVLTERVIPVVAELVAGDDPDFKIEVYKISKKGDVMQPLRRKRGRTTTRH